MILSDEELKQAEPKKSRQIEISDFVGLARHHRLLPVELLPGSRQGAGADKAYALLRQAMAEAGRIGIATLVMRNKEYLVAIRPGGGRGSPCTRCTSPTRCARRAVSSPCPTRRT